MNRSLCHRCLRPEAACYCAHLPCLPTRTRLVFLQHPRERRVAIGTCRMAHLALPNSELHLGVHFAGHARVEALAAAPAGSVAVLFPGEGAKDPSELGALQTLIVIDGTWPQAKKLVMRNPALRALPRVGFMPSRPGNYRIRKEPQAHCLSTIEAVVEVLGRLEGQPDRFRPMLDAFTAMIDLQIRCTAERTGPSRHRLKRPARLRGAPPVLVERFEDLVILYAEANAQPAEESAGTLPELIQLVAHRPSSGERFEAVLSPRQPLAESTAHHLEIPAAELFAGQGIATALGAWRGFLRPGDLLCGWGYHALNLLQSEGESVPPYLDLRVMISQALKRRSGGIEEAAALLGGAAVPPIGRGRAGRRLGALVQCVGALRARFEHRVDEAARGSRAEGAPSRPSSPG